MDYYPYLGAPAETLASGALCLFFVAILIAISVYLAVWIIKRAGLSGTILLSLVEFFSVVILVLIFLPTLISVNKTLSETMKFFWRTGFELSPSITFPYIPLGVILVLIVLRLLQAARFKGAFNFIVALLWKPALAVTVLSVVWIAVFFIFINNSRRGAEPQKASVAQGSALEEQRPNIFLITFDMMSAADMSLYGSSRKTTPFLERMSGESFVFNRMHSNYHSTQPSLLSILTSKYPWTHGVFDWLEYVKEDADENLGALLSDDYETVAIVPGMYHLPEFFGLKDQFDSTSWVAFKPPSSVIFNLLSGLGLSPFSFPILRHINIIYNKGTPSAYYDEPFIAAKELVKVKREKPLFLWIHLWPPHWPNNPPPYFRGAYLPAEEVVEGLRGKTGLDYKRTIFRMKARYDECILFADYALENFIGTLKKTGLYDNSIIIVSADHGNTIDTDNTLVVSPMMEEQLFSIPLLIHLPGQKRGARIDSLAEHVDLAPTILELINRDIPEWMDGESLIPYMKNPALKSKKIKYSMSFVYGENNDPVRWFASFIDDYKLVYHMDSDSALLFNINDEHTNENNLARIKYKLFHELKSDIRERIDENYGILGRDIEDIVSY